MKRRTFSAEFKKKIALEALKEQKTVNEIAASFEVHPAQVSKWKKELVNGASSVFEDPRTSSNTLKKKEQQELLLQQKVGQLTIEIDWLKKKLNI